MEYDVYGVVGGMEKAVTDQTTLGIIAGYAHAHGEVDGLYDESDADIYQAGTLQLLVVYERE